MSENKFYVTTPIYYVTAKPHLGHLYSTVLADLAARWHALQGQQTFFLTGTDEHGQKVAAAALKASQHPQVFVDSFIAPYKDLWRSYNINYNYFIRTTDKNHKQAVQDWIEKLLGQGDIYKSTYAGWYCTPCETFVTQEAGEQNKTEGPVCPSCSRGTSFVEEEAYFFKLSAYQERLLKLYQDHPDFVLPKERLSEVVRFVESGLKDLCISRTTVTWGIPFRNDPKHVTYVWADALNNYVTAIGYLQEGREQEFARWWPADVQVMGKDIVRFHAVYWPAFLMASGLALPKHLLVHGWFLVNQQKMSKSLGNALDPIVLEQLYGAEPVRYYLAAYMAINHDCEVSIDDIEHRISQDLANELGNLVNRIMSLAKQHNLLAVACAQYSDTSRELKQASERMLQDFTTAMRTYEFHKAYAELRRFVALVNAYVHAREPWKQARIDRVAFEETVASVANSLQIIATMLAPVLPAKMNTLLSALGRSLEPAANNVEFIQNLDWSIPFILSPIPPLFEKVEGKYAAMNQSTQVQETAIAEVPSIEIDQLLAVHIAVGTINEAQRVPKSDKLLQLQVDLGSYGQRQVLAGIGQSNKPEDLVGRQAAFVVNLKPRKLMGLESQGMVLVAEDAAGNLQLMQPTGVVANGTRLR